MDAMQEQTDYTPEEWDLLVRLPAHIGFAVMIAEQAAGMGRRAEIRELRAAATTAAAEYADNGLVQRVAQQVRELLESDDLVKHSRDKNAAAVIAFVADECEQVLRLLAAHSTAVEAAGYKRFALSLGQQVAEAHADAEFFGIGGQTVSRKERKALNALREALDFHEEL